MDKWDGYWEFPCPVCGGSGGSMGPVRKYRDGEICITKRPVSGMLFTFNDEWYVCSGVQFCEATDEDPYLGMSGKSHAVTSLSCAPLLPAPSQLQAHGLTACDALKLFDGNRKISLDAGCVIVGCRSTGYVVPGIVHPGNITAVQRDLQKYTALLQWMDGFKEANCECSDNA